MLLLGSEWDWNLPKYRQHLFLLLESSTGLEEYILLSKRQCPLFVIFYNKLYSIWSLAIFNNDQTLILIHLGYSVDQWSLDNEWYTNVGKQHTTYTINLRLHCRTVVTNDNSCCIAEKIISNQSSNFFFASQHSYGSK